MKSETDSIPVTNFILFESQTISGVQESSSHHHAFDAIIQDAPLGGYYLESLDGMFPHKKDMLTFLFGMDHTNWIGKRVKVTIERVEP